jgi:hypothetical protein
VRSEPPGRIFDFAFALFFAGLRMNRVITGLQTFSHYENEFQFQFNIARGPLLTSTAVVTSDCDFDHAASNMLRPTAPAMQPRFP